MSRILLALLVPALVLGSTRAAADTFGGWRYTAPPGYTTKTHQDHVALTQVKDSTFCSIAIFESRWLERSIAVERAYEFYNTVTHAFAVHVRQRSTVATKLGTVMTTTATLVDADNNHYAATHFVITPPGRIGSVLAIADSHVSLASCAATATRVVRSLDIDWTSPRITDPEARVETPQGH